MRPARCGVAWSMAMHSSVLALAVAQWLQLIELPTAEEPASQQVLLVAAPMARPTVARVVLQQTATLREEVTAEETIDAEDLLTRMVDPRWQELVEPVAEAELEHAGSFVSEELQRVVAEAERRSSADNLEKLAELSERLTSVSSEGAVDDINSQLRRVLQTEDRAERPAEKPVEGPFDFTTAQLDDVSRKDDGAGGYTYTATLVDSAGRKFESPMAASEGETAFRTMKLIKSNPLLEKVYRGVVMSMLDRVLKSAQ